MTLCREGSKFMEGFMRPDAVVLGDNAMVANMNVISPAPNQFTHELTAVGGRLHFTTREDTALSEPMINEWTLYHRSPDTVHFQLLSKNPPGWPFSRTRPWSAI